jgi:hypothetical protein
MSKKSESKLPGELNENYGSNYMMDGFWHDMEYEHGLKEDPGSQPIPQPSTSGMAQLPDGMILALVDELEVETQEDEGGIDLEGLGIVAATVAPEHDFDVDRSDAGIVDHTWFSEAYQDPTRLPDKPVDNGIPELQEAWGDRTDGIVRIDLQDRDAIKYQDGFQGPEDDDTLFPDKLASFVQSAMRRSAAGEAMSSIKRRLASSMNVASARKIFNAVKAIEAEHGLAGNVYVRASAYPGLEKGKWRKELIKAAKGARYMVAACGQDCSGCACSLGLQVVEHPDQIDWNDAYAHYSPKLEVTGRLDRKATVMDKRVALQHAFQAEERVPTTHIETAKVHHTVAADLVSSEEAVELIQRHDQVREHFDLSAKEAAQERLKLVKKLGALSKANLITVEEAQTLMNSDQPVQMRMRMANMLAARTSKTEFSGALVGDARVSITAEEFAAAGQRGRQAEHNARTASASEESQRQRLLEGFKNLEARYQAARDKLAKVIDVVAHRKMAGAGLRKWVDGLFDSTERQMVKSALDPVLVNGGYFDDENAGQPREYQGGVQREAEYRRPEQVVSAKEISKVVRWARQQMSEGFASRDLDALIDHRVEPRVKQAAEQKLVQIRKRHEGLSGHLYVDAAAYATAKTAKGCEEGALRHRANQLPYVLSMSRCGSCVFKNADGVCQKYNKKLVDEVPAENVEEFRRQALASHDMSDAEETASMFHGNDLREAANPNPVDEFGLHNATLDDLETEDSTIGTLDGIFFGGFEL